MSSLNIRVSLIARILIAIVCCAIPIGAAAQSANTGALAGLLTDPSGAAIAGAQIQVTNEASGETRTITSGADGRYVAPLLAPGLYRVEISKTGFKTTVLQHIQIVVTETRALNLALDLGQVTEHLTVEAQAEQLQTESSTLGVVTTGEQVTALPLVTRNYLQIIGLNAGASVEVTNAGELGRGGVNSAIVSNGNWAGDNNFQMDGVGINDLQSSGAFSGGVAIPNPDSIQEFKVQTSQYDASYGRNAGANVDVITKTGTNQMHGSLWEFFRNDVLNANTFFRKNQGEPRPVLKQNQFGFTLGGPIVKDKLEYFGSYQGTRQRNGIDPDCSATVKSPPFTNDRSAGAIGALFAGQRGYYQDLLAFLYDLPPIGPAIAGDGSNVDPVALAVLNYKLPNGQYMIPTPQTVNPSASFDAQGTSAFSIPCPYTENQFMTNADYRISSKGRLSGRFFFANSTASYTTPITDISGGYSSPGFPFDTINNFRNFSLTHTYVFRPTLLNQLEIGFHRTFAHALQHELFSWSDVGATVPPPPNADDNIEPAIAIDYPSPYGVSTGGNGQSVQVVQNTYEGQESLTWVKGRETFRFGGGLARMQGNNTNYLPMSAVAYPSWADFLLGLSGTDNGTAGLTGPPGLSNVLVSYDLLGENYRYFRTWEGNAFVQDDLKVTPRLTLNLGLRYEHTGDLADKGGKDTSFDPTQANPNPPAGGVLNGIVVPHNYSGPVPDGVIRSSTDFGIAGKGQNSIDPRIGFSWRLPRSERFVLRGGYGVFHTQVTGQAFMQSLGGQPFAEERLVAGLANGNATNEVPFNLNVPNFPAFIPYSPTTQNTLKFVAQNYRPPILQQYSLGLQSQLAQNLVLEVGYSGSRGQHLLIGRSINQALDATEANPIRGQTSDTLANIQLRVPYEGWVASGLTDVESTGASWYNALLVSLNKRFSHGLQFQASYTYSKELTNAIQTTTGSNGGYAYGDQNDAKARYGPEYYIRPQRLVINYSYSFPKSSFSSALARGALDGWMVTGVTTFQTGHFMPVLYNNPFNIEGITNDRAELSGTCNRSQYVNSGSITSLIRTNTPYINTTCFTTPPVVSADGGTAFGNSGVGIMLGPSQLNFDFSVIKHFAVKWPTEGAGLDFRTEFFNLFNHPQFSDPDVYMSDSTFGLIGTTAVAPRVIQFALKFSF
jgi:hypothetical protein